MSSVQVQGNMVCLNAGGDIFYYCLNEAPLGAGAMGTVYRGFARSNRRIVAIKKVKDRFSNVPAVRERAKLEAQMMFRHPNLVEMLGYCETSPTGGPIFIISNYVNGENFDDFVKKRLSHLVPTERTRRICELFYPVFDALDYLHVQGIVHMDIKPSNIMVEHGHSNVRLMDLGIVHVQEVRAGESASSGLMGTPKYAAPEQFDASVDSNKISPATDIYEAGITLYELLTGQNPFVANTLQECVDKHLNCVLPYSENVPNAIVDVLRQATAPNAHDRFKSAKQMKRALEIALTVRPKKSVSNLKWIVACFVGVITLLVLIIAIII